jgi:hypothetical protein
MDLPAKLRRSFKQQTGAWVAAAAVVGTLVVLLPFRKRKIYVDMATGAKARPKSKLLEAGFLLGVLRVAVSMFKPTIANFVAKKLETYGQPRRRATKW